MTCCPSPQFLKFAQQDRGSFVKMAAEAAPSQSKLVNMTTYGSMILPDDPEIPAPYESHVLPELGEFVLQHASQLEKRGVGVTELNSIFTSIKLAAKVVNRIITRQGTYGLDGES